MTTNSTELSPKLSLYLGHAGLDLLGVMLRDERLRPTVIDGKGYISLVGLMDVFGDRDTDHYSAREFWRDQKRRLQRRKPELWENISQLKLLAEDGKMRLTDVADLETCLRILLYMDTPSSDVIKDLAAGVLARMTQAEINYRAFNIVHGSEMLADTTHELIGESEPIDNDPAFQDWGYSK